MNTFDRCRFLLSARRHSGLPWEPMHTFENREAAHNWAHNYLDPGAQYHLRRMSYAPRHREEGEPDLIGKSWGRSNAGLARPAHRA